MYSKPTAPEDKKADDVFCTHILIPQALCSWHHRLSSANITVYLIINVPGLIHI